MECQVGAAGHVLQLELGGERVAEAGVEGGIPGGADEGAGFVEWCCPLKRLGASARL